MTNHQTDCPLCGGTGELDPIGDEGQRRKCEACVGQRIDPVTREQIGDEVFFYDGN